VEPIHPELRAALKEAHPGLTDQDIDRTEELLSQRMRCDPDRDADLIARLDQERLDLIRRAMPHYAAVAQAVKARTTDPQAKLPRTVTVTTRKPKG